VWFGFTQRKAVLFIYLICMSLGVSGVLLRNTTSLIDGQLALFQGFSIVAIVIILMVTAERRHSDVRKRYSSDDSPEGVDNITPLRPEELHSKKQANG
jgi:hypothetical protein